nr:MAG: hypothetical protein [Sesarmops intermedium nimavirus]
MTHGSTNRQAADLTFSPLLTSQNKKEKIIVNLKTSIKMLKEGIPHMKQYMNDGVLKYEDWNLKDEENSLSGLQKALDLVLNLQPSAYLKMTNFQDKGVPCGCCNHGKVILTSYDVVWVNGKWECMLFRHVTLLNRRVGVGYYVMWSTSFVKDVTRILVPCVTIQRWWKNILCLRYLRVCINIQRRWREILYRPKHFFKTSMFSEAKRNFDTLLKTRTMDIAKAPAEESTEARVSNQKSPLPPSSSSQPCSEAPRNSLAESNTPTTRSSSLLKRRLCVTTPETPKPTKICVITPETLSPSQGKPAKNSRIGNTFSRC